MDPVDPSSVSTVRPSPKQGNEPGEIKDLSSAWNTLTFAWMHDLLKTGNTKPLDLEDLYSLPDGDRAEGIYQRWIYCIRSNPKIYFLVFYSS